MAPTAVPAVVRGAGLPVKEGPGGTRWLVAIMGGNGVKLGDEVAPPSAQTTRIRLVSIMGGSEVRRGRKRSRREGREWELGLQDRRKLDP